MTIAQLKAQVSIDQLDYEFQLGLKQGGVYHCPFCGSASAFKVKSDGYICYRCSAKGDIINLMQDLGLARSFSEAVSKITRAFNIPELQVYHPGQRRRLEILDLAFRHYEEEFQKSTAAQEYCQKRGWSRLIDVGYCPAGEFLQQQGFSLHELEEAGLAKSGYELMANRAIFAIRSAGKIVHLSGRSLEPDDSLRWLSTRGIPPITSYLMNGDSLLENKPSWSFLTEGVSDTYSLMQLKGISVAGTFGIHAPVSLLSRYFKGVKRICAVYDSDVYALDGSANSGLHKSWSVILPNLIELSSKHRIEVWCFVNQNAEGKDINDLLVSLDYDRDRFLSQINSSVIPLTQLAYQYYYHQPQKKHLLWKSLVVKYDSPADKDIRAQLTQEFTPESIGEMLRAMQ